MEKVGSTLFDLMPTQSAMSVKTVMMIGLQTLTALQEIHECGIVHRDIKPDNIAVGLDSAGSDLYFIDLGLSTEYLINHTHVNYSENSIFQGTPYFCSENALRGIRVSRRDDLESLGYVLLFFNLGSLPWMNVKFGGREDLMDIIAARTKVTIKKLCKDAHPILETYLSKCQSLSFSEKPDYSHLRSLFQSVLDSSSLPLDWQYDWLRPKSPLVSVTRQRRSSLHSKSLLENLTGLSEGMPSPGLKIRKLQLRSVLEDSTDGSEELNNDEKTPLRNPNWDGVRLRRFSQCYKLRGSEDSQEETAVCDQA